MLVVLQAAGHSLEGAETILAGTPFPHYIGSAMNYQRAWISLTHVALCPVLDPTVGETFRLTGVQTALKTVVGVVPTVPSQDPSGITIHIAASTVIPALDKQVPSGRWGPLDQRAMGDGCHSRACICVLTRVMSSME